MPYNCILWIKNSRNENILQGLSLHLACQLILSEEWSTCGIKQSFSINIYACLIPSNWIGITLIKREWSWLSFPEYSCDMSKMIGWWFWDLGDSKEVFINLDPGASQDFLLILKV